MSTEHVSHKTSEHKILRLVVNYSIIEIWIHHSHGLTLHPICFVEGTEAGFR